MKGLQQGLQNFTSYKGVNFLFMQRQRGSKPQRAPPSEKAPVQTPNTANRGMCCEQHRWSQG